MLGQKHHKWLCNRSLAELHAQAPQRTYRLLATYQLVRIYIYQSIRILNSYHINQNHIISHYLLLKTRFRLVVSVSIGWSIDYHFENDLPNQPHIIFPQETLLVFHAPNVSKCLICIYISQPSKLVMLYLPVFVTNPPSWFKSPFSSRTAPATSAARWAPLLGDESRRRSRFRTGAVRMATMNEWEHSF